MSTYVLTKPDAAWELGILLQKNFHEGTFPWEPKALTHDPEDDTIVIFLKDLQEEELNVAVDAVLEVSPYDIFPIFRCEPWKGTDDE